MKRRLIAAAAVVGLVAALTGFGSIPAMADEGDESTTTTTVADETTPPADETTPPADDTTPPADDTTPPADDTTPPADDTTPPGEEDSTEEESTEEDSTEEDSTEEDSTEESTEEESTEESAKIAEEATEPPADLPVVDGFTPEQVAEALAYMEENQIGVAARFGGIEICHWEYWSWGWDTETVGILGYVLHYLFDSNDIMPGFLIFPAKNFDTDYNGLTGEQIYYNDCSKKVKVYKSPEWGSDEYCWDGVAQPGSLWVYYTYQMEGKATWVITGPNGYYYEVPYSHGWIEIDVPAGSYSVELVSNGGWYIKHGGPYWITIYPAENCGCTVNPNVDQVKALDVQILAEPTPCAEAEVSTTPPTCEAASTLVLGATFLASFGEPTIVDGHYTVTATADAGYRFDPGEGVPPDGSTKTFEGDLAPKLTTCGLPVTGAGDTTTPLWLAGLAIIAGLGALVISARRSPRVVIDEE